MGLSVKTREQKEENESKVLSPLACLSSKSKGRDKEEKPDELLTAFEVDRKRLTESGAHMRLQYKTQAICFQSDPYIKTRYTHTHYVGNLARELATILGLNEILADAIAMGHDIGHTPFGHIGEDVLTKLLQKEGKNEEFRHAAFGVTLAQEIENEGEGSNLTWEVQDGILHHSAGGSREPNDSYKGAHTIEGQLIRWTDKMAYTLSDLNDAKRAGYISSYPDCALFLGRTRRQRENTLKMCLIDSSVGKDEVLMEGEVYAAFQELRNFLTENVYNSDRKRVDDGKFKEIIYTLYDNPGVIEDEERKGRNVIEHIACLTDLKALQYYRKLKLPSNALMGVDYQR